MNTHIFNNAQYRKLIFGKLVSLLGSNIMQFALSLYVLNTTGSATLFASMLSISILPRLLLTPFAGVISDRWHRKHLIVGLDLLSGVFLILMGFYWIAADYQLSILSIYIIIVILEMIEIFFHAAMSAVLPSIVPKAQYLEANSFQTVVLNIGQLMAPVLGALLYMYTDMLWILWINGVSFILSSFAEMLIVLPKHVKKEGKLSLKLFYQDTIAGLHLIKNEVAISSMISLATIINFCIAPLFSVGLIYIIKSVLLVTDFEFGFYQMAISLSMIITPLFSVKLIKRFSLSKVFFRAFMGLSFIIFGLALILSPWAIQTVDQLQITFYIILVLSFLTGMLVSIANLANATIFQKVVPLSMMGRVSSVMMLLVTIFVPIGQMIFGILYDIMDPSIVIFFAGLILMVSVILHKSKLNQVNITEQPQINKGVEVVGS
jgi:MFS family permease